MNKSGGREAEQWSEAVPPEPYCPHTCHTHPRMNVLCACKKKGKKRMEVKAADVGEKKGKWKCHFARKEKRTFIRRENGGETLRPKAFFPLFFSPFSLRLREGKGASTAVSTLQQTCLHCKKKVFLDGKRKGMGSRGWGGSVKGLRKEELALNRSLDRSSQVGTSAAWELEVRPFFARNGSETGHAEGR